MLNSLYPRNQIATCAEGTFNISDVPSINVSWRECVGKASLFVGQWYRRCNYKTSCQNSFCSCRKSNKLCDSKCHHSLSFENKWHSCLDTPFCLYIYIFIFFFLTNWCNEKSILAFFSKEKLQSTTE